MASEVPIARTFVVCREIIFHEDKSVSLEKLVEKVVPLPGESFPYAVEPLALYALLTNGRGPHEFSVELHRFELGQEVLVGTIGPVRIELGQDPLEVLGLPIPIRRLIIEEAGQYEFTLTCDGLDLASVKLSVR